MKEPGTNGWYVPLVVPAVALIGALIVLVAVAEMVTSTLVSDASPTSWVAHLARADEAQSRGNAGEAMIYLQEAHVAAFRSRHRDGLLQVGDAYRRLAGRDGSRAVAEPKARAAYRAALFQAQQERSLDGVLHAVEGLAALGDREMVSAGLQIAASLAARGLDPRGPARVRTLAARWSAGRLEVQGLDDEGRPAP